MSNLGLSHAQYLVEALNDPAMKECLQAFFRQERIVLTTDLVQAVRKGQNRDVMNEASIAGEVRFAESGYQRLLKFAQDQLKDASQ